MHVSVQFQSFVIVPAGLVEGFPGGFPGFPKGFPMGFQGFPHKRKGFPLFRPSKSRGFLNIPGVVFPDQLFAFIKLKSANKKKRPPAANMETRL